MKLVIGWLRESSRPGPFGSSTCTPGLEFCAPSAGDGKAARFSRRIGYHQSRWNIGSSGAETGEPSGLAAMISLIIAHQRCMISFSGKRSMA